MASKCPYEKVIFILKKSIKEMETLLHKKSDNVKFLTSYSLDIRAWSTETQTNISLLLYNGVLTHSATLVSLYTYWKYLKLSFFDVPRGYRKRHEVVLRTLKCSRWQMFFRIGVLNNFAMFKGKQLSWSLFLIKSQTSRPANLLKRDSNSSVFLWILRNF